MVRSEGRPFRSIAYCRKIILMRIILLRIILWVALIVDGVATKARGTPWRESLPVCRLEKRDRLTVSSYSSHQSTSTEHSASTGSGFRAGRPSFFAPLGRAARVARRQRQSFRRSAYTEFAEHHQAVCPPPWQASPRSCVPTQQLSREALPLRYPCHLARKRG